MDDGDLSTDVEIEHNERVLREHARRNREQPDFNDDGAKVCIDCDSLIPEARAKLDFVVRCIYCQEEEDKRGKLF